MMTQLPPREYVLQALAHQESCILPYQWEMVPQLEAAVDEHLGGAAWRQGLITFIGGVDFSLPHRAVGENRYTDIYGSVWVSGDIQHLVEPALAQCSLSELQWPDVDRLWSEQKFAKEHQLSHASDLYRQAGWGAGLFERAWALRGFEDLMMDMACQPHAARALFYAIYEHQSQIVGKLLEVDVDGMFFGDDWGQQRGMLMSPAMWRDYIKPLQKKLYDQVHAAGKQVFQHCCGSIMEILPEVIEIGVDCLHPVQYEAMDVFKIKRIYGRDLALWGAGPSQSIIPFGTPDEIRECFSLLRDQLGSGGGYICAPGKTMLIETPVENAIATVEGVSGQRLI